MEPIPLTFMEAMKEASKGAVIAKVGSRNYLSFKDGFLCFECGTKVYIQCDLIKHAFVVVNPAPKPATKPKVKMALYAYRQDKILGNTVLVSRTFHPDSEDLIKANPSATWFKRLDWSEIEVEG